MLWQKWPVYDNYYDLTPALKEINITQLAEKKNYFISAILTEEMSISGFEPALSSGQNFENSED